MNERWRIVKWAIVFILAWLLAGWVLVGRGYSVEPSIAAAPVIPRRPIIDPVLMVDASFVMTVLPEGDRLAYVGVSENILDQFGPELTVQEGDIVELMLLNVLDAPVDIGILGYDVRTPVLTTAGTGASVIFEASEAGEYTYCSFVPGLAGRGLLGRFIVREAGELPSPEPAELFSER